jgi:hypothetical protein
MNVAGLAISLRLFRKAPLPAPCFHGPCRDLPDRSHPFWIAKTLAKATGGIG